MKVLVIKTSSLGDVIHTLPALTDAAKAIDNISFDANMSLKEFSNDLAEKGNSFGTRDWNDTH